VADLILRGPAEAGIKAGRASAPQVLHLWFRAGRPGSVRRRDNMPNEQPLQVAVMATVQSVGVRADGRVPITLGYEVRFLVAHCAWA
jgi:hypothetical protein